MDEEKQETKHQHTFEIYTNSIEIRGGIYEVIIDFNLSSFVRDNEMEIRKLVRVRMSPQQAKALSILLNKHLKVYGEQFSEIFLPDELMKKLFAVKVGDTHEQYSND